MEKDFAFEKRKRMVTRLAVALLVVAVASGWCGRRAPFTVLANAAPAVSAGTDASQNVLGRCVASAPKSWGAYRGSSEHYGLTFEGDDGTLRFVTNVPCDNATPFIALEIRRTSPASSGQ